MSHMVQFSKDQYDFIKGSRDALFEYCKTINSDHFIAQNTSFGRGGSIRNILVHIANTYQYWIGNLSLKKNIDYTPFETITNLQQTVTLFQSVDEFMDEFISRIDSLRDIEYEIQGVHKAAKSFKIFSHVITHEYHHKGQVLSLSRHLGYIPVDTDIMR